MLSSYWLRLRDLHHLLASLLRFGRVLPIALPLDPVQASVHVVVLEVGARLRALVFLPRVVIKVNSLVVNKIDRGIVLLLILESRVVLPRHRSLLFFIRAVMELAIVVHLLCVGFVEYVSS